VTREIESVQGPNGEAALHDLPVSEALGILGQADWELVSITPHGENAFLYTFKRPVAHP